jgi:hypothetical protein
VYERHAKKSPAEAGPRSKGLPRRWLPTIKASLVAAVAQPDRDTGPAAAPPPASGFRRHTPNLRSMYVDHHTIRRSIYSVASHALHRMADSGLDLRESRAMTTLAMRWSKATSSSPVRHRAHEVQEPPRGARQHLTNQPSARFYASVVLCWCGRSILFDCATFSRENSPCTGTSKRLKNACARRRAQKAGAQSARADRDDVKR